MTYRIVKPNKLTTHIILDKDIEVNDVVVTIDDRTTLVVEVKDTTFVTEIGEFKLQDIKGVLVASSDKLSFGGCKNGCVNLVGYVPITSNERVEVGDWVLYEGHNGNTMLKVVKTGLNYIKCSETERFNGSLVGLFGRKSFEKITNTEPLELCKSRKDSCSSYKTVIPNICAEINKVAEDGQEVIIESIKDNVFYGHLVKQKWTKEEVITLLNKVKEDSSINIESLL